MNIKRNIAAVALPLWSGLGFYRGYKSYENHKTDKLKAIGYGLCAIFIYINPIALPLTLEAEYKNWKQS